MHKSINKVKSKTFPFSINELIEEMKAQEILNHIPDEIKDNLDGQGAQNNSDILDEGLEDVQRPTTDFSAWLDDEEIIELNTESCPRAPHNRNLLCGDLWGKDSARKSLILMRNPFQELLLGGISSVGSSGVRTPGGNQLQQRLLSKSSS